MAANELVILLAEDDDGHAHLEQSNLKEAGSANEFVRVQDGPEALPFLRQDGAHVEALRQIRLDARTVQLPVALLTTTDDPREVRRCYDLGCSGHVTNPVEHDRSVGAIRRPGLCLATVELPRGDARDEPEES